MRRANGREAVVLAINAAPTANPINIAHDVLELLPSLKRDRAITNRIRVIPDAALLRADHLIIRDDLATNPLVRLGKNAYEGFLNGYWTLLQRTLLAGARHAAHR